MKAALKFSLAINALLLGTVLLLALAGSRPVTGAGFSRLLTNRVLRLPPRSAPVASNTAAPVVVEINETFRWSQVESEDYRVYVANLRNIGCPEATVRDLVVADVNDLFAARVKALVDEVTGKFWELTSHEKDFEQLVQEKEKQLRDLEEEREAMFEALFGDANPLAGEENLGLAAARRANWEQLADFLPAEKRTRFAAANEELERTWMEFLRTPNLTGEQQKAKRKELEAAHQAALGGWLTADELAELRLRQSSAAELRHRIVGVELSETETRLAAQIQLEKETARKAKREPEVSVAEASLKETLGADRYAALQRAQDGRYDWFHRVVQRLELPEAAAVEAFDVRRQAEDAVARLRADKSLSADARQAALLAVAAETKQSLTAAFGPNGFAAYQRVDGNWLQQMIAPGR